MPGSQTPRGPLMARANAIRDVAFHIHDRVGTPTFVYFVAQWLACSCPCERLAAILTGRQSITRGHREVATSFGVGLFHPLLYAGLALRCPWSKPPGRSWRTIRLPITEVQGEE